MGTAMPTEALEPLTTFYYCHLVVLSITVNSNLHVTTEFQALAFCIYKESYVFLILTD
jgi:hypothetical protein